MTSRSRHARPRRSRNSKSGTRSDSRARSSTGWSSSATVSRFPRRTSPCARRSRSPCSRPGRRPRRARSSIWTSGRPGSSGIRAESWSRSSPTRLARRAQVRPPRHLDGHDRRRRPRLTDDGYVHSDLGFFAGREVPVVRADLRHRHDHPAEAESRRAARSLRAVPRPAASRSTSPRNGISSQATRAGRQTESSSTSPPTKAAKSTCSASRCPAAWSSR